MKLNSPIAYLSLIALLLSFGTAQAKVFKNAYVAFELPDNWRCNLEQTEWVCRSEFDKQAREAVIILTAKEVGPTDSFQAYETHLNTPQQISSRKGQPLKSRIVYKAKTVKINNQKWIDGLHLNSEIPNYFTRYVATIKDKIAILVTFSADQKYYTRFSKDFFRAVMSLRVIASKGLLEKTDLSPLRPGSETLGLPMAGGLPSDIESAPLPKEKSRGSGKSFFFGIALLLAGIAAYLFIKSRKK